MKRIDCIHIKEFTDLKKYIKNNKYDDVINYNDITNKLIKSDIDNKKPSIFILNTYIRRKLQRSLESKSIDSILYILKNLNTESIFSIKDIISELHDDDYIFNLIIINNNSLYDIDSDVLSEFDNFYNIEV